MTDQEIFVKLVEEARRKWFPKLKVVSKGETTFMLLLNAEFWTTWIYTVYVSASMPVKEAYQWWTLAHELTHMFRMEKRGKFLWYYLYAWPLSQGVLILLTCWLPVCWSSGWVMYLTIGAWVAFGGLHFIPQLPDYWREKEELEAYTVSMYYCWKQNADIPDSYVDRLVELFTDMSYYKMSANKQRIRDKLIAVRLAILADSHSIKNHPIVLAIAEIKAC